MRKFMVLAAFMAAFCFSARGQAPAGHKSFVAQLPGWYLHNLKAEFTELRHDRKWLIYSIVSDAAFAGDAVSSSYGIAHGYHDVAAGRSQRRLWVSMLSIHFLALQPMAHATGEELENVCKNDNSAPEQWKHIPNTDSCRYAYWIGGPAAAIHFYNAGSNIRLLNRTDAPVRPDLSHVQIIERRR
jgi:hypothetical protein